MKKKLLILNDRFALKNSLINLGDRALSDGLYRLLGKHLDFEIVSGGWKNFPYLNMRRLKRESIYPDIEKIFSKWLVEVTELSQGNDQWEKYLSNFLDKNIIFRNWMFNNLDEKIKAYFSRGLIETIKPFVLKRRYGSQLINKIKEADLVLYSGGAMVADRFSFYLPMGMFECFLAKKLGKPVVAANQTLDIRDPFNFKMVSFVYQMLDFHITREPLSRQTLVKMDVPQSKVIVSCDTAFYTNLDTKENLSEIKKKEGIGKGCVGLVFRGDGPFEYQTWVEIIKYIQTKYGKKVFLFFTCRAHDHKIYKKLSKICNLNRLSEFYDTPIIINLMRKFDFIIADRYHAIIFAILAHTPVLPINPTFKTVKTEGLFALFDYALKVLPPVCNDNYKDVIKNIDYIEKHQDELRAVLSKVSKDLKNKGGEDIKAIAGLIP